MVVVVVVVLRLSDGRAATCAVRQAHEGRGGGGGGGGGRPTKTTPSPPPPPPPPVPARLCATAFRCSGQKKRDAQLKLMTTATQERRCLM